MRIVMRGFLSVWMKCFIAMIFGACFALITLLSEPITSDSALLDVEGLINESWPQNINDESVLVDVQDSLDHPQENKDFLQKIEGLEKKETFQEKFKADEQIAARTDSVSDVLPCHYPRRNVAFSKTHKCGSSTLQNIMFRYGYKHHLKFVLPPNDGYSLMGGCSSFSKRMVERATWHSRGYNMMAIHTIWDGDAVRSVMPSDTIHISIVRDPVEVYESLYQYYNLESPNIYNMTIRKFLLLSDSAEIIKKRYMCLGRNQMLYDFGLHKDQLFNHSAAVEKIQEIDRTFHFVMISEYFDESLILLRDLLCWKNEDILYLSQNRRKTEKIKKRTVWEENRIRVLNKEDNMLYQHFLKKFKEKMNAYGEEKLKTEVEGLRRENEKMKRMCVTDKPQNLFKGRFQPYGKDVQRLFVKEDSEYCAQFATLEMYFIDQLRNRQRN